jgi:hypothetical protein
MWLKKNIPVTGDFAASQSLVQRYSAFRESKRANN